jgi:dTDP-glucose 4,6-dehydratase
MPIQTLVAGAAGTRNCLELATENSARFVLASTSEVYGDPLMHPQPESYWGNVNPVGPRSPYDEAKRYAEALTVAYHGQRGVNTGIARIFNCYGPRLRPDDGRAIPTFICQALLGQPLTVAGDGTQTRSACYVHDLVEGLIRLADRDVRGPVNLGNPEEISVLELAERVRDAVGSDTGVEFFPRPPGDPSRRRPDVSLARELLDWQPTICLDDGLKQTIAWFRDAIEQVTPEWASRPRDEEVHVGLK